jgi:hypothetical protein
MPNWGNKAELSVGGVPRGMSEHRRRKGRRLNTAAQPKDAPSHLQSQQSPAAYPLEPFHLENPSNTVTKHFGRQAHTTLNLWGKGDRGA